LQPRLYRDRATTDGQPRLGARPFRRSARSPGHAGGDPQILHKRLIMPLEIAATGETLQLRARLLARIRSFFQTRGVLEVETPALSSAAVPDSALVSIEARVECHVPQPQFLHTSPEYAMKRLLAAGNGDIFQLCRVFRDGELGRWHQPGFTLLEWYRVGWDECALMDEVEALLRALLAERALGDTVRVSYRDALNRHLGLTPEI